MSADLSRRSFLRLGAAGAVASMTVAGAGSLFDTIARADAASTGEAELKPLDPIRTIFDAMARFPLVGIAELHFMQEWHDFITALLFHPALPAALTDIVVEFGNAQYQQVADRFILGDEAVSRPALEPIWRYQGWDAPVYEQFFRTVRAVNWMRPASQRIRVLLGAQPFDVPRVRNTSDPAFRKWWLDPPDEHYTSVVEQKVLGQRRRALLIAGGGHLLRGIYSDRKILNVATQLEQRHPGSIYVVDSIALRPGLQQDTAGNRLRTTFAGWPRPSLAVLAGTWLGSVTRSLDGDRINQLSSRAVSAAAARYDRQADAILYLGPGERLTASQADPTLFEHGSYRRELERLNPIVSQIDGQHEDLVAESLKQAKAPPSWFAQFA
jgi:hypothetical protein